MRASQWADLETFLLSERHLAPPTAAKTLRYARLLERAGVDPLRPSRSRYNAFLARRKQAGLDGPGTYHYGVAAGHLLAWRHRVWPGFRVARVKCNVRPLLPDAVIAALLDYDRGRDELETQAARFAFRFGFYLTRRPPSEHLAVRVQDFDRRHGTIRVWSAKMAMWRTKQIEPWFADEIADYIDGFRAQVARRDERALLVDPYTGRTWTTLNAYAMWLKRCAAPIYESFRPYDLRIAGATWRIIQWEFNIYLLKEWLDHASVRSSEGYLRVAETLVARRQVAGKVQPYKVGALA